MTDKVYVYNETEVVKTGRVAKKQLRKRVDEKFEVTPKDKENGSWKKWVHETDLYEIIDET